MDQVIGFIVLLIILSLLEKALKGQRGKTRRPPPAEDGWEATGEEHDRLEERGTPTLRELLAEELGLNLERKPTVRRPPETPSAQLRSADSAPASVVDRAAAAAPTRRPESAVPPDIERVVYYPTPRRPKGKSEPAGPGAAAALRTAEARKLESSMRREGAALRLRRTGYERLPGRGDQAASLERPRRPEDHQLSRDRRAVLRPVSSHEEYHAPYLDDSMLRGETRRSRVVLPDDPEWSAVQRAIVWSEVLGPPKGLD